MGKTYRPYLPEQDLLLPPSLRDWLPEGHLAYFVSDLIDELNLSAIESYYEQEERGYPPNHPRMMTKILVYGYCVGASALSRSDPPVLTRSSIRGDVKKKHFFDLLRSAVCLTSSPCLQLRNLLSARGLLFLFHRRVSEPYSSAFVPSGFYARLSSVGSLPTMVLSETRGLLLCWVIRGGIRWPLRLGVADSPA